MNALRFWFFCSRLYFYYDFSRLSYC